jgi:hypothetical protein
MSRRLMSRSAVLYAPAADLAMFGLVGLLAVTASYVWLGVSHSFGELLSRFAQ